MKKLFTRIFIIGFVGYFILYTITKLTFLYEYEIKEQLPKLLLESGLLSFGIATLSAVILYFSVRKRFQYIEARNIKKPDFYVQKEFYISLDGSKITFEKLQEKIKNKWVLTYADSNVKVLKFRTKMNFLTWGTGCYLKYDAEIGALNLVSFPVGADLHGSKHSEKYIKKKLMQLVA